MEKSKLISLKTAIKDTVRKLFENTNLGFVFKAHLYLSFLAIFVALPTVAIYGVSFLSTLGNPKEKAEVVAFKSQEEKERMEMEMETIEKGLHSEGTDAYPRGFGPNNPYYEEDMPGGFGPDYPPGGSKVIGILTIIAGIMGFIFGLISFTYITLIPVKLHQNDLLPPKELFKEALRKTIKFIILSFLISIITLVGFMLLIVPGVVFMIWFLFAPYILLAEDTGIIEALKKSKQLTKGYRWPLLGRGILYFLLIMLAVVPIILFLYLSQMVLLPVIVVFLPLVLLQFMEDLKDKEGGIEKKDEIPESPFGPMESDEEKQEAEESKDYEEEPDIMPPQEQEIEVPEPGAASGINPPVKDIQTATEDAAPIEVPDPISKEAAEDAKGEKSPQGEQPASPEENPQNQ